MSNGVVLPAALIGAQNAETATPDFDAWRQFDRLSPHEFKFLGGTFAFPCAFGLMRQGIL